VWASICNSKTTLIGRSAGCHVTSVMSQHRSSCARVCTLACVRTCVRSQTPLLRYCVFGCFKSSAGLDRCRVVVSNRGLKIGSSLFSSFRIHAELILLTALLGQRLHADPCVRYDRYINAYPVAPPAAIVL
jgi:hypothetical protein